MVVLTGFRYKKMYGRFARTGEPRSHRTVERTVCLWRLGWVILKNKNLAGRHTPKTIHARSVSLKRVLNDETNYMHTRVPKSKNSRVN